MTRDILVLLDKLAYHNLNTSFRIVKASIGDLPSTTITILHLIAQWRIDRNLCIMVADTYNHLTQSNDNPLFDFIPCDPLRRYEHRPVAIQILQDNRADWSDDRFGTDTTFLVDVTSPGEIAENECLVIIVYASSGLAIAVIPFSDHTRLGDWISEAVDFREKGGHWLAIEVWKNTPQADQYISALVGTAIGVIKSLVFISERE